MMTMDQERSLNPINFKEWIAQNRHLLKPPVGNRQVWEDREFMVTVVGGPNFRLDYHINRGEEFFYQVEGDITLRLLIDGKRRDMTLREGEIFLLPADIPHSPQRPPNTVGLVLERKRLPHELDSFLWICDECGFKLHEESLYVTNIVDQLPPVFERFYQSSSSKICKQCGAHVKKS